jgi:hypothetical protein
MTRRFTLIHFAFFGMLRINLRINSPALNAGKWRPKHRPRRYQRAIKPDSNTASGRAQRNIRQASAALKNTGAIASESAAP